MQKKFKIFYKAQIVQKEGRRVWFGNAPLSADNSCLSWDAGCYGEGEVLEIGKKCNTLITETVLKVIHNLSKYSLKWVWFIELPIGFIGAINSPKFLQDELVRCHLNAFLAGLGTMINEGHLVGTYSTLSMLSLCLVSRPPKDWVFWHWNTTKPVFLRLNHHDYC